MPIRRVDALQGEVMALVGHAPDSDRRDVFDEIRALAHERAGLPARPTLGRGRLATGTACRI